MLSPKLWLFIHTWEYLLNHRVRAWMTNHNHIYIYVEVITCPYRILDAALHHYYKYKGSIWLFWRTLPSNRSYHFPQLKCFSSRLAVVFAQSTEIMSLVKNEDALGAAPTGDAPITSEWSRILSPTKVRLILEVWWYFRGLRHQLRLVSIKEYLVNIKGYKHIVHLSWNCIICVQKSKVCIMFFSP